MNSHIFVYGSLMFPEVWQRVVRGRYRLLPADVDGCVRLTVSGEIYPGMIVRQGCRVRGMVYFDVEPADVARLDRFEGREYARAPLSALLLSGETVQVSSYVYLVAQRLTEQPWQPDAFQIQHFLDTVCADELGGE